MGCMKGNGLVSLGSESQPRLVCFAKSRVPYMYKVYAYTNQPEDESPFVHHAASINQSIIEIISQCQPTAKEVFLEMLVDHLLEAGGSGAMVPWYNVRKDLFLDKVRWEAGGGGWGRCG